MNRPTRLQLGALFLLVHLACSSTPHNALRERATGPEPTSGLETVAILGTNDIHGALAPFRLKTREKAGVASVPYEAGGSAVMAAYIKKLRSEFGEHLLWLDAGDEFQGSIDSNLSLGAPMVTFFNQLGLNAAAIGNHEFDFGLKALTSRMSEAHYPYLAANISDKYPHRHVEFPNTYPHALFKAGRLHVGVIGLSTLDTPKTTRSTNVVDLNFDELKTAAMREAEALRSLGANLVVITAHVGLQCDLGNSPLTHQMRKPTDPQGECGEQDEMVHLLQSLPAGTVDAVVSGHSHQVVHHWIAGVPVIQAGVFGRYLNLIYLTYDWAQKKVIPEETRIEGPIHVCSQIFQNQNDCNGDRPAPKQGRGPLIQAQFHGEKITPDEEWSKTLSPILKRSDDARARVITQAARPIEHERRGESELGNLIADAVRKAAHSDFSIVNSGGIRSNLEAGPITYSAIFRVIPFENQMAILKVTGKELLLLLRVAESGSRGVSPVSGLKIKMIDLDSPAPSDDLNGDENPEEWKTNRLLSVTTSKGEPIIPDKIYTVATLDFLVQGGDDWAWPISKISKDRIQLDAGMTIRDAVVEYLETQKLIHSVDNPLIDPNQPRFILEKITPKPEVGVRRKKKHRSH